MKIVKTFATTMLLYERLERRRARPAGTRACARPPAASVRRTRRSSPRLSLGALASGRAEPARADEARAVPAGERLDAHAGAGVRGVDEAAVADVHARRARGRRRRRGRRGGAPSGATRRPQVELGVARVRQRDAEVAVDVAHEAGAVEARARGCCRRRRSACRRSASRSRRPACRRGGGAASQRRFAFARPGAAARPAPRSPAPASAPGVDAVVGAARERAS